MLIPAIQHSESAIYIHISPPSWTPCHPIPYPTTLGHHRAPSWDPCAIPQLPTSYLFYALQCTHVNIYWCICRPHLVGPCPLILPWHCLLQWLPFLRVCSRKPWLPVLTFSSVSEAAVCTAFIFSYGSNKECWYFSLSGFLCIVRHVMVSSKIFKCKNRNPYF